MVEKQLSDSYVVHGNVLFPFLWHYFYWLIIHKCDMMLTELADVGLFTYKKFYRTKDCKGPFKCYVTLFSWEFDPYPPPRNANNVEPYTAVTLFSRKADTHPPPTALRNTWMAPNLSIKPAQCNNRWDYSLDIAFILKYFRGCAFGVYLYQIMSARDLARQMTLIRSTLSDCNCDWEKRVEAVS